MYQPSLFRATREEIAARTSICIDEMETWHRKGWLSFDPVEVSGCDQKEETEVWFIKGLAPSGLSDAMISRILADLEEPYFYEPLQTFYSFCEGKWIGLPPQSAPENMAEEAIEELIADENWSRLRRLSARISEALESIDENSD